MEHIKRFSALFLAIIFSASFFINARTETSVLLGDVNNDGKITAADARITLLASAKLYSAPDIESADIDNDNIITAIDARYILRAAASLESLVCIRYGHDISAGSCLNCDYTEPTSEPDSTEQATETESVTEIHSETTTVTETTEPESTTAEETTTNEPETTTEQTTVTTTVPETTTELTTVTETTTAATTEITTIPETTTRVPETTTNAPEPTTETTTESTTITETTTKAESTTNTPEESTTIPETTTIIPETTTKAPEEHTTIQETTTSVPETTTEAQEESTTAPETTTKVPEEHTTVPESTTSVPETTTEAPETTTATTTEATTAPEPPTRVPETTTVIETTTKPVSTEELAYETFILINEYRASLGLYPLTFNAELSEITLVRAKEASVLWSHTRPDGRDFWSVFDDYNKFNAIPVGEILAKIGAPDAARAVNGWRNSPSHNAILTTTKYKEIGIACYIAEDGYTYFAAHTIKTNNNESTTVPEESTTVPEESTTTGSTTPPVPTEDLAYETFLIINEYRASHGLYPLTFNAELSEITLARAKEIYDCGGTTRPDGSSYHTIFDDYNKFNNCSVIELSAKFKDPDATQVVASLYNSPLCDVMLTSTYTQIGVAYYFAENGYYYFVLHMIQ